MAWLLLLRAVPGLTCPALHALYLLPRSSSLDVMQMVKMSREQFERLHATDPCGVDKLPEGIKAFASDQVKLEAMLARMASNQ